MDNTKFVYVTYVASTPSQVWNALIDPKMTAQYWQHENVSDWKPGSRWEHRRSDEKEIVDLAGTVMESAPPRRLVISWYFPADEDRVDAHSRVTFGIDPFKEVVRLTLTHERLQPDSGMLKGITDGWPMVLSSLKSLLETGRALPRLW